MKQPTEDRRPGQERIEIGTVQCRSNRCLYSRRFTAAEQPTYKYGTCPRCGSTTSADRDDDPVCESRGTATYTLPSGEQLTVQSTSLLAALSELAKQAEVTRAEQERTQ